MQMESVIRKSSLASRVVLLGLVALLVAGCARRAYRPHEVPEELQPPPVADVHRLDLSRIAGASTASDTIVPGDVLSVSIASGYEDGQLQESPVRVGEDGWANVLLVGRVELAGLELEQAEQTIAAAAVARGIYRSPQVTTVLAKRKVNRITVVGAVNTPGVYELPRTSSGLLEAIVAAGGLGEDADRFVEIRRPQRRVGPQIFSPAHPDRTAGRPEHQNVSHRAFGAAQRQPGSARIDLVSAVTHGGSESEVNDGDVVMVSRRDTTTVKVMGLVNRPGEFPIPAGRELRVLDAISLAGGRPLQIANKVKVIRALPGQQEPAIVQLDLKNAKRDGTANLRLAPGDVVTVEETPATMVVQTLQSFVRFGFSSSVPF